MRYIKIILTINLLKPILIPEATATSAQDVNISSVYGLRLGTLRVEIVD
jgi:hypothetical protein